MRKATELNEYKEFKVGQDVRITTGMYAGSNSTIKWIFNNHFGIGIRFHIANPSGKRKALNLSEYDIRRML